MAHDRITGSFVALITPFNGDGSIDWEAFPHPAPLPGGQRHPAVLIMGSTGEVSMLSAEERRADHRGRSRSMKTGRMQLFYGCTGNNTATTIAACGSPRPRAPMARSWQRPPTSARSEADLEAHLPRGGRRRRPAARHLQQPATGEDRPGPLGHLLRLFEHPNYVIHKESTSRVGQVAQMLAGQARSLDHVLRFARISAWSCRPWRSAATAPPT